jgi:hypothetical protein
LERRNETIAKPYPKDKLNALLEVIGYTLTKEDCLKLLKEIILEILEEVEAE